MSTAANAINESTAGITGFTGTAFVGTPVTNHNVILGGATSSTLTNVAPSATSGVPLISQGASADPTFGTVAIAGGGTNATSMSTNTGIVKYDGTSLVTSSTAKIDSSNRYTNTSQPCFLVAQTSTASNVTGDGTIYTVVFGTTIFDQASNFSSTTFTAPVAGNYLFTTSITVGGLTASFTDMFVNIVTTNRSYQISSISAGKTFETNSGSSTLLVTGSAIANMSAGHTATVTVGVFGSTKTVAVFGASPTVYFSGCLLC